VGRMTAAEVEAADPQSPTAERLHRTSHPLDALELRVELGAPASVSQPLFQNIQIVVHFPVELHAGQRLPPQLEANGRATGRRLQFGVCPRSRRGIWPGINQMEKMAQMWRPNIDLQVVLDAAQVTLNDQLGKPRFLACFAQSSRFQRLTDFHAAARHLNASIRKIRLPEDQQVIRMGDVNKRFGNMTAARHRGFDEPITSAQRHGLRAPEVGSARPTASFIV